MKRKIENTMYIICALIIAWIMVCWINVAIHNGCPTYDYPRWNMFTWFADEPTTSYVVTDCEPEGAHYVVTIKDNKGNLWSYYDYDYKVNGTIVCPIWDGDKIIDIKGGN